MDLILLNKMVRRVIKTSVKIKILQDKKEIPYLGIGTWNLRGNKGKDAIKYALEIGYRHIDTAAFYNNEIEVGDAIRESGLERKEIFVTTKIWTSDLGYKSTKKAFSNSLNKLNLDYIDLYLIHWPGKKSSDRTDTWKAMLELKTENLIKSVGVSNFAPNHLEELIREGFEIPVVNQINFSPFNYNRGTLEYCQLKKIAVIAYTPLNSGKNLDHNVISRLGSIYKKSGAQIVLRWALQKDILVIPKSARNERIFENSMIFDFQLKQEEMKLLDHI